MGLFDLFGHNILKDYEFQDVITLTSSNGAEVEFSYVEGCKIKGKYYAVLEEKDADEDAPLYVFRMVHEKGDNYFSIVTDPDLKTKVFEAVSKKLG